MAYLSNIKKQYFISFFHSLIPAYVIERLFYGQRGMTVQMVVYMEIIYALTITVLEIPTGILADKFGRKRLIAINAVICVLEFTLLLFSNNFLHFALVVFMCGVGGALASGSQNALIYDSLIAAGKQDGFEKISGRITAIEYAGHVTAALSGAVTASFFGFEFNYIISAGSALIACVLTFMLKEPPMISETNSAEKESAFRYIKKAAAIFKAQPLVFLYCVTGAVLGSCAIYLDEFWQIVMENINFPVIFFGLISASVLVFRIPGNMLAYKLKEKFNYRAIFIFIIGINAAGFTAIFLTRNIFCLIPMAVISLASGIVEPLVEGYLHRHTESNIRATAESFSSLGLRVLSAVIGLAFGYVSSSYSVFAGFLALGIICFTYFIFFAAKK